MVQATMLHLIEKKATTPHAGANALQRNCFFTKNSKSKKGYNSCKMILELSPFFVHNPLFKVNIHFEFLVLCSVMAEK